VMRGEWEMGRTGEIESGRTGAQRSSPKAKGEWEKMRLGDNISLCTSVKNSV
jgi:hypothetical protein